MVAGGVFRGGGGESFSQSGTVFGDDAEIFAVAGIFAFNGRGGGSGGWGRGVDSKIEKIGGMGNDGDISGSVSGKCADRDVWVAGL